MFNEFISYMRGQTGMSSIILALVAGLVIVLLVLPFHEWAHGYIASKLGDPTAKKMGRLTLNPLAHVDPMGSALLVLFGFGWAKPVPVNPYYFRKPKRDMALVALAGPVANIIAAFVGAVLCDLYIVLYYKLDLFGNLFNSKMPYYIVAFFTYYILINCTLAIFNLIPFPPLDGSRILSAFLPDRAYMVLMRNERIFFGVLIILMLTGAFSTIISVPTSWLYDGIMWLAGLPFKLFIH